MSNQSDDDESSSRVAAVSNAGKRKTTDSSSDSEDTPIARRVSKDQGSPSKKPKHNNQNGNMSKDSSSDEDVPIAKKAATKKVKADKVKSGSSTPTTMSPSVKKEKKSPITIKKELTTGKKRSSKQIDDSSDDSDEEQLPLKSRVAPKRKVSNRNSIAQEDDDDSDEEDVPLAKRKAISDDDEFGDESSLTSKKKKLNPKAAATKVKVKTEKPSKKALKKEAASPAKVKVKKEKAAPVKKEKKKDVEKDEGDEEEDEGFKWWKEGALDNTIKWTTLEHKGPLFPPEYVPHGVKMKYDGKEVTLKPVAEEVATFYAGVVGTDHAENPTFNKNFFRDFLEICKEDPKNPIKEFEKCDFTPLVNHLQAQREAKKQMTKADKQVLKKEKEEIDKVYGYCLLDGRTEKVGNFRIEPPGLFRGRGEHPRTGTLKQRVTPEQVTINIGKDAEVPKPPEAHQWGSVQHDNTVTWLATWKDNVNDNIKYIFLAANSSLKGQSDFKKFEKARELKKIVANIRESYTAELKDKMMAVRQRATAMYLIDKLALRAGNEKGEEEADTVGCCSLRYEHITLEPPNKVIFDFLGKDSIRYYNEVEVDTQVFKNLKLFKKEPKTEGDNLFDRLTTPLLNKHLTTYMPGLTAKVFRTYNASECFQVELEKTPKDATVAEKVLAYNRANREVAVLCNHQRSVPKAHGTQMGKMKDKIAALKFERKLLKAAILANDPKLGKKRPELKEDESDYDSDIEKEVEANLEANDLLKMRKKVERTNEKVKAGEDTESKIVSEKELEKMLDEAKDTVGAPAVREKVEKMNSDRLEKRLTAVEDRIKSNKLAMTDKDEGKTTALGTSKLNYIDPRISVAWCYTNEVPLEKIFNATLREKFKWATDLDADWKF